MTLKNRVLELDKQLTPKRSIIRLIQEMHQYGSPNEYLRECIFGQHHQQRNDFEKVRMGIEARMKEQDKKKIHHAVAKAQREGLFLYWLMLRIAGNFEADYYRFAFLLQTLLYQWQRTRLLSYQILAREEGSSSKVQKMAALQPILKDVKKCGTKALYTLILERRLAEAISERYFDGAELVFQKDKECLANMTEAAINIIEFIQEVVSELACFKKLAPEAGQKNLPPLVNIKAIKTQVEADLESHVQYTIDLNKADVLSELGSSNIHAGPFPEPPFIGHPSLDFR